MKTDWDTVGGYGPESLPGHSGSETSEAAARQPKGRRMKLLHEHLQELGPVGATCKEMQNYFEIDHGAASGALTRLHRAGFAVRLQHTRDKQQVYVLAEYAEGREESPYRPNSAYREDHKPMPLERPEPTLQSITEDLLSQEIFSHVTGIPLACDRGYAEQLAWGVLQIVRKYR